MMRLYYLLILLLTAIACGKSDAKNEKIPQDEPKSNEVYISGINDDYIVAMNGKMVISPTITRENEQTDSDLEFEWMIDDKSIAKSKEIDITLPNDISNGDKKGKFNVHCLKFNTFYSKDFDLIVTNPFGYGYYFISVTASGKSLFSHINIDDNSETVFHTSVIGTANIGDNVHSLSSYSFYDKGTEKLAYKIFITSEKGATPHIVTESKSLTLLETISSTHNGILFSPKMHILGYNYEHKSHFISESSYMLYQNSVLSPKNNELKFSYIIPGNNDKYLYAYDSSKGKFYSIDTENNHDIIELSGNLSSEKIIGYKLLNYYDNGKVKEKVLIMSTRDKKISLYKIVDNRIALEKSVDVQSPASCAIPIDETTWMISAGNLVYSYDEQQNLLTSYFTLDENLGEIEMIASSKITEKLVIATYNQRSEKIAKGSIVIVNKNGTVKTYKDVIYRCKGITCCDAKTW